MNDENANGSFRRYRVRYSTSLTGLAREKKRLKKCFKLKKTSSEIEEEKKQDKNSKKIFKPFSQIRKKSMQKDLNESQSSQTSIKNEREKEIEELDRKIAMLNEQCNDASKILVDTAEKVISRMDDLNILNTKADDLQRNASSLGLEAKCVRKKLAYKNKKSNIIITVSAFLGLGSIVIIVLKSVQII